MTSKKTLTTYISIASLKSNKIIGFDIKAILARMSKRIDFWGQGNFFSLKVRVGFLMVSDGINAMIFKFIYRCTCVLYKCFSNFKTTYTNINMGMCELIYFSVS